MSKLKKITSKIFKSNTNRYQEGNGLYVSLDELMNMRKYASYIQNQDKSKTYAYQSGDVKSVFKGRGMEMDEIREYQYADDVRDIDWRVTARKEKPYTKIYTEERDREVYVWLDLSSIMMFGSVKELKSVTASKIAALLGWVALNNKDRFGCVIFDGERSWIFKPRNDRAYLSAILKKIAEVSKYSLNKHVISQTEKMKSLKLLQTSVKNKAGLFIVSSFGCWDGEVDAELAMLAKKTKMIVVNVFDKLEEKAPISGQYMAEYNGEKVLIDTTSKVYRKKYVEYFEQKRKLRKDFCKKFGCQMIDFSADKSFISLFKII